MKTAALILAACCVSGVCAAQTPVASAVKPKSPDGYTGSAGGYEYAPDMHWTAPPAADVEPGPSDSAWIVRGGASLGQGYVEQTCSGSGCGSDADPEDFREEVGPYLALDYLVRTSESLRLGVGLDLIPNRSLEGESGDSMDLGTQAGLMFLFEPLIQVSPHVSVALRGQAGMAVLWPGKELEDAAAENERVCDEYDFTTCEADPGPFAGAVGGVGTGLLFRTNETVWRVDAQVKAYLIRTLGVEVADGGDSADLAVDFRGVSGVLTAGVEL